MKDVVSWMASSAKNVINLDLRGNPGYTGEVHQYITTILLRNIKTLLKSDKAEFKEALDKGWINKELLELKIPLTSLHNGKSADILPAPAENIEERSCEESSDIVRFQQEEEKTSSPVIAATSKEPMKPKQKTIFTKMKKSSSQAKLEAEDIELPDVKSISFSNDLTADEPKITECKKCPQYFKELMQSESRCIALTMENRSLRKKLNALQAGLLMPSQISGIPPMTQEHENISIMSHNVNSSTVRLR